jgi:pilus assembly protein CpaB
MNDPGEIGVIDHAHATGSGNKKNIIVFVVALLMGGVGVYLSKAFIESKVEFYKEQYAAQKEETRSVVVVGRPKKKGEIITQADLVLRDVPVAFAHKSAVLEQNYNLALGQRLTYDIDQGMPLLWPHLEAGLTPTFSGKIVDGKRAITIPVDEVSSISGFLQPSDNIDLYYTDKMGKEKAIIPLIQNLHVMATGIKTDVDKTGKATKRYQTITVLVTPLDAKRIFLAREISGITASLRNPEDIKDADKKPLKESELLGKKKIYKKRRKSGPGIEFIVGGV